MLVEIGTTTISHNNGIGDDFSLTPINPVLNSWVSPTMSVVAGPCGAYGGSGPETVFHYAAGGLTHLVVDTAWLPSFIAGTRIGKVQQIAGGWSLVSSPLCL